MIPTRRIPPRRRDNQELTSAIWHVKTQVMERTKNRQKIVVQNRRHAVPRMLRRPTKDKAPGSFFPGDYQSQLLIVTPVRPIVPSLQGQNPTKGDPKPERRRRGGSRTLYLLRRLWRRRRRDLGDIP